MIGSADGTLVRNKLVRRNGSLGNVAARQVTASILFLFSFFVVRGAAFSTSTQHTRSPGHSVDLLNSSCEKALITELFSAREIRFSSHSAPSAVTGTEQLPCSYSLQQRKTCVSRLRRKVCLPTRVGLQPGSTTSVALNSHGCADSICV